MKRVFALLLTQGISTASIAALAQAPPITRYAIQTNAYTGYSLQAQSEIELQSGFSTSSEGFSATIAPVLANVGQWSTQVAPYQSIPWGFIGIHTHVLPNGIVLSWQGHNDNQFVTQYPGQHPGTDAYLLGPDLSRRNSTEFHISWTNAFCTGHSFLPDGKLLITGGHYGDKDAVGNPLGYIKGLPHASTYDFTVPTTITSSNQAPGWQSEHKMIRNR